VVELWKANVSIIEWAKRSGHYCQIFSRAREDVEWKYICGRSCKLGLLFYTWIEAKQWGYLECIIMKLMKMNGVNDEERNTQISLKMGFTWLR